MIRLACVSDSHNLPPPAVDESGILAWLHAGDVCDRQQLSPEMRQWLLARVGRLHMVLGNHDCALAGEAVERMDVGGRLCKLADNPGPVGMVVRLGEGGEPCACGPLWQQGNRL